ncbi:hypothetical protein I7I48_00024 [Histoplasma ohiense]|nr:hypothetical protein I7I48_00024 [Histoplasma ohiense (nom. inval.)]
MQVLKAVIVSDSFRVKTLEKEKDVKKKVLKVMNSESSVMERLIEKRLMEEELTEESMKKIVEMSVTAAVFMMPAFFVNLPLTSVEQRERMLQTVEK